MYLRNRRSSSGLGAGLSARAMHLHGFNTTIAEIDPVVYDYARRFFGVEVPRGGAYLEDARSFLDATNQKVSPLSLANPSNEY